MFLDILIFKNRAYYAFNIINYKNSSPKAVWITPRQAIMKKNIDHSVYKEMLSDYMSVDDYHKLSHKIKEVYKTDAKDICSLPSDVATLALSNNCDIHSYVDFHTTTKLDSEKNNYKIIVNKLSKLF